MEKELEIIPILDSLGIRSTQIESRGCSLITLFDDILFTQCDFDIIDGHTRNLMTKAMRKKGFTIKGSRSFTSPGGEKYQFAKPSHTLGCNPADKVFEIIQNNTHTFCTPTQALLVLAESRSEDLLKEEYVKEFLFQHPANIKKVLQWISHDKLGNVFPYSETQLDEWNELGAKRRLSF